MRKELLLFILFISLTTYCTSNNTQTEKNSFTNDIDLYAKSIFDKNYKTVFNLDSSFCYCISSSQKQTNEAIMFIVYDLNKNEMILKDVKPGCKITWQNNEEILVKWNPEIVKGTEDNNYSYIFNVRSMNKKSSNQMIVD